jgi:predicted HAD superfamily Cof-like phosphohydrolase
MYSNKQQKDVFDFMLACGQVNTKDQERLAASDSAKRAKVGDLNMMGLRRNLLLEEVREYVSASDHSDFLGVVDGLVDIMYIAHGTLVELGVDFDTCWNEVHSSNMTKVDPETGEVKRREDGKILKPKSYRKPDLKKVIFKGDK